MNRRLTMLAVLALTLGALVLRLWRLDAVPPGWRDDELINSLVISQHVLDGDWAVYYPDASGHEALYHVLNAAMVALFGPGVPGIRWLSVLLGTLAIPLTYRLGRRLLSPTAALVAAAVLAVSFWSLMYSRIGLRHVSLPIFALTAFIFFWRGLQRADSGRLPARPELVEGAGSFLLAGLFTGLGFYTYFASRGVPLILLTFGGYLWLADRPRFRRMWPGLVLMLAVAAVLALPLAVTLARQPESEARVAELAVPLIEAGAGNLQPLGRHIVETLGMFHHTGDGEWLYNIPGRPLFGPVGAIFFWAGVALAAGRVVRRNESAHTSAFLLLWWLAGIAPAFISVPPASLSHTILAQPAVYLLAASPLTLLERPLRQAAGHRLALAALAALLIGAVALRDLPDYFQTWPARGNTRFLYRADLGDVADYLAAHPTLTDFAISGLMAGPWDRIALELELEQAGVSGARPRWYHPGRAAFVQPALAFSGYPVVPDVYETARQLLSGETAGGYRLTRWADPAPAADPICFGNGLCWETAVYDPAAGQLELGWGAERPLDLPPVPLVSNPPPPGVDVTPRLAVFVHLLAADGALLAAGDGLWVDPASLQAGDRFRQLHFFDLSDGAAPATAVFGLYDPQTGQRILAEDGRDALDLPLEAGR